MIKMNEEEYIEYLKYRKKREEDFDNAFELNYWGDEYPKVTSDEINKITKTEWEYKKLQNNWNELKKCLEGWLENDKYCYLAENPSDKCRCEVYKELLDKMQELEQVK